MTTSRRLLSVEAYRESAVGGSVESSVRLPVVEQRRAGRAPLPRRRPANPVHPLLVEVSQLDAYAQRLVGRTRRFADLETLIVLKERALRRNTWVVPEDDIRLRLLAAKRDIQREGLLSESARLAQGRRRVMRPASMRVVTGIADPSRR